ncbi:hypothetical protein Leryth_002854 [Lithospermum erythrorhizon]|nr:hypothetical protein Leryth_002854 [Lithospermum erythrorhizon]
MFIKRNSVQKKVSEGFCGCFGFGSFGKHRKATPVRSLGNHRVATSQELLLDEEEEDEEEGSYNGDATDTGDVTDTGKEDDNEFRSPVKRSEEILKARILNGMICREIPVKETHELIRSERWILGSRYCKARIGKLLSEVIPVVGNMFYYYKDEDGNKMVNQYIREYRIGAGSYGKVVLYRNQDDGKHYAIKLRVAPSETAMSDVLLLEYVEGKWVCEGAAGDLGEDRARKYLRDIVCGLMYLHAHDIVHGDIKPDNLLVTASGTVKIGDFSVSQVFEDGNDELRRSPGTPVFTAPECCLGLTYRGRAADTWAVGVTLYYMVFGNYPFLGDTLQDTYDKLYLFSLTYVQLLQIVHNSLDLPDGLDPLLKDLIEGILCKDPAHRMTLEAIAEHPWFVSEEGPLPQYPCWCKRDR